MTVAHDLVIRARDRWGCLLSRITASLTVLVAVLLGAELATSGADAYDVALVGAVALGAVLIATWLWRRNSFEARVAAVLLAVLVLVGQVLVSTVGAPGDAAAEWQPSGVAVAVLALLIPVLVTADARQSWPVETPEHPYAL